MSMLEIYTAAFARLGHKYLTRENTSFTDGSKFYLMFTSKAGAYPNEVPFSFSILGKAPGLTNNQ